MQIHNQDALKHAKTLLACSINNIFTDPPYFAGSVIQIIDNLLQFKGKGKDFMSGSANSWNIEELGYYEELAKEWFRAMKYGGYVVMYSLDRYSWIWTYLMVKAGFEPCQTMYWANISNFPKATDASKSIDRRLGELNNREVVKERINKKKTNVAYGKFSETGECHITSPATDLAKLFEKYKYGLAPLKKITEPILVFRKPCKYGSVLNDLMACQTDPEISPAVLDIENNRVGTETITTQGNSKGFSGKGLDKLINLDHSGRFPATLFISPEAAELLDSQLDLITFELNDKVYENVKRLEYQRLVNWHVLNNTFESCKVWGVKREVIKSNASEANHEPSNSAQNARQVTPRKSDVHFGDSGFISRVLHQPDFSEADFASLEYTMNDLCQYSQGIVEDTIYHPTVSRKERHLGCNHLLYKGIENLFVLHTKKGKTQKSKIAFDDLLELDLETINTKKSKDKDKLICKIFFDLVCEASESEVTDSNFVEIAQAINQYENEFGFYYLGNDTFKVFYQDNEYLIEAKNVVRQGNGHPTLKSISLNKYIFSLFLLPKVFNQVVYVPFSGTGSEVIGVMLAGVKPENIISVEFNPDYVAIQKARIEYFANQSNIPVYLPKSENETQKPSNKPLDLF